MSPYRPRPPAFVVDTDVVVAGVAAFRRVRRPDEPFEAALLRRWRQGEWRWVTSEPLLEEYRDVLIARGARAEKTERIAALIRKHARLVEPRRIAEPLRDPDDAHVIGTARAAGAPVVTRNVAHYPAHLVKCFTPADAWVQVDAYLKHPMTRRPRSANPWARTS